MRIHINCEDNPHTFNKKNYLVRASERLGLDVISGWSPGCDADYVLNIEPYSNLGTGKIWTGAWWIDTLLDNVRFNTEFPYINTIFLAGTSHKVIPKDNHRLLFQAADTDFHKPMSVGKECDFILAGTMGLDIYRERERCIDLLRKEGFSYIGAGKNFKGIDYGKQLNRARVQFIRSMEVDGHGEIAQRFFECLAIGPVLTNYVTDLKHTGLVENKDYLAYRSDEEMIEKMHWLVDDPHYAFQIAENGRYKSKLYHTYEHRLMTIIQEINEYTLLKQR